MDPSDVWVIVIARGAIIEVMSEEWHRREWEKRDSAMTRHDAGAQSDTWCLRDT
jgi:hypothetical protein